MTSPDAFTWPGASKKGRRTFTRDFKRELVEQTLVPGASIAGIALANGINTNQLFTWRRKLLPMSESVAQSVLLPVHLESSLPLTVESSVTSSKLPMSTLSGHGGMIEIVRSQTTVRLHGRVNQDTLRVVLQCLAL